MFLFFLLKLSFEVKHPLWSLFQVYLADLPGSFSCCLEQLFCREPANSCFWRKELHNKSYLVNVITRKAESCSLEISVSFSKFRRIFGSKYVFSCVGNCVPYVNLQLRLKRDFSKFLGELLSRTCHAPVRFAYRVAKRKSLLLFFSYLSFLLRTITIQRTAGEGGGYFYSSSVPLPPASQTLRHSPAINAESSPLHLSSCWTWTIDAWYIIFHHRRSPSNFENSQNN